MIQKLKKPLYGLSDASRKFELRVKEVFHDDGMTRLQGDEAFYQRYDKNEKLEGLISSHVDNFVLAGQYEFLKDFECVPGYKPNFQLKISQLESDHLKSQLFIYFNQPIGSIKDEMNIWYDFILFLKNMNFEQLKLFC